MVAKLEIPNLNDLIERYESGVSLKQLADETGLVRITLMRHFKRAGVELRGRSEAERLKWLRMDRRAVERQCSAAWASTRGVPPSMERKRKMASTLARRLSRRHGLFEDETALACRALGLEVRQQTAVYCYNIDMTIHDRVTVAVEIFAHRHPSRHREARFRDKAKRILDLGWPLVLVIYFEREAVDPASVAHELLTFTERARRDESLHGKYGMIRGDGHPSLPACMDLDGLPRIEGL